MNRVGVGVIALASLALLSLVVGVTGCGKKKSTIDYAPDYNGQGSLSQQYDQKLGLVRLHFPADFVADPDKDNLTFIQPLATASVDRKSLITITTVRVPVTQDLSEYARATQGARATTLAGYKAISVAPGNCYRDIPGVETRWQFDDRGTPMQGRACAFLHNRHGYSFMYAFKPNVTGDETQLRRIVDATDLTD